MGMDSAGAREGGASQAACPTEELVLSGASSTAFVRWGGDWLSPQAKGWSPAPLALRKGGGCCPDLRGKIVKIQAKAAWREVRLGTVGLGA